SPFLDQFIRGQRMFWELSDADAYTGQRQGRNDHVDARSIRQASVNHRAAFIDAAAKRRDDSLDNTQHIVVVPEPDWGQVQLSATFDNDLVRPIDQNLGDRVVGQ